LVERIKGYNIPISDRLEGKVRRALERARKAQM